MLDRGSNALDATLVPLIRSSARVALAPMYLMVSVLLLCDRSIKTSASLKNAWQTKLIDTKVAARVARSSFNAFILVTQSGSHDSSR